MSSGMSRRNGILEAIHCLGTEEDNTLRIPAAAFHNQARSLLKVSSDYLTAAP